MPIRWVCRLGMAVADGSVKLTATEIVHVGVGHSTSGVVAKFSGRRPARPRRTASAVAGRARTEKVLHCEGRPLQFVRPGACGRRHLIHDCEGRDVGCRRRKRLRQIDDSTMRLIEPDDGEVIFDGEAVGTSDGVSLRDLRRNMQMVFQDSYASLNPRLPIEETVAFGPRVHGLGTRPARARARTLLSRVGLDPDLYARRYPHELSGGQRQRVNIARALALEPRLVILDEAVSALDKSVEAQVLNLLSDLQAEFGLTYMFISHDLNVVHYLSD